MLRRHSAQRPTFAPEGPAWLHYARVCSCPKRTMLSAALWPRCRLVPHCGHVCQRTDKPLYTKTPQLEQACEVNAGGPATTVFPASTALQDRMLKNAPQP